MEQPTGDTEPGDPEPDLHSQIEVRQHMLPDGYFPTKFQLLAAIMDVKIAPPESAD